MNRSKTQYVRMQFCPHFQHSHKACMRSRILLAFWLIKKKKKKETITTVHRPSLLPSSATLRCSAPFTRTEADLLKKINYIWHTWVDLWMQFKPTSPIQCLIEWIGSLVKLAFGCQHCPLPNFMVSKSQELDETTSPLPTSVSELQKSQGNSIMHEGVCVTSLREGGKLSKQWNKGRLALTACLYAPPAAKLRRSNIPSAARHSSQLSLPS